MVTLYNSYAKIVTQTDTKTKVINSALPYEELNSMVTTVLKKCGDNYTKEYGLSMLQEQVCQKLSSELEDFI